MKKTFYALIGKDKLSEIFSARGIILTLMCCVVLIVCNTAIYAQNQPSKTITGSVMDASNQPMLGVTVLVKGTTIGTITDVNGNFSLSVPGDARTLVFSFVGMETREVEIGNQTVFNISLAESTIGIGEVVVIGYGSQKKESLVGAIVQASNEQLKRTGGVVNLTHALSATLPGVTTMQSAGMPGRDDPRIIIRAVGTWNNSAPLILVDGIERKMNDIDISEVESISVLKDASATAVFGVKGAEGVILINTKRGKIGKPEMTFDVNYTRKVVSRVPAKEDSYSALYHRNKGIEHELNTRYDTWSNYITPVEILNKYKLPQTGTTFGIPDKYIFPNVDFPSVMLNDAAHSYRANFNISGGTDFAKYFGSLSYSYDGDLLNSSQDNGKGYEGQFSYNRMNYRTNMDFNLTRSTILSTNISGFVGRKLDGFIQEAYGTESIVYQPFYSTAPTSFYPRFPSEIPGEDINGNIVSYKIGNNPWGYNAVLSNINNAYDWVNNRGVETVTQTQVSTDFILKQKLDFITQGLSVQGSFSYDTRFTTAGGIYDAGSRESFFINPAIVYKNPSEPVTNYFYGSNYNIVGGRGYDFVMSPPEYLAENMGWQWSSSGTDRWGLPYPLPYRRMFYQLQANYARTFDKHDVGVMALFNREQFAESSMFPRYREDWVGRLMYNYDNRYMFETNGAYNGSEKFGKGYRFGFFPSVAVGWMVSNEEFLKRDWLDKLKFRYSIGKVGNDNFASQRWAYETGWALDDRVSFGYPTMVQSYYIQYIQSVLGNPDLGWEAATKQNFGIEIAVLKNRINFNADIFKDHRTNIFMSAAQRKIPTYFGANAVAANLGETKTQGYELDLRFQNTSARNFYYWMNWTYTHAVDEIIYMEDPELMPDYLKKAGFQIDQYRTIQHEGIMQNWDDVYAAPKWSSNNQYRAPGEYDIIDFNGDGKIDSYDSAPFGYPQRPQNTYSVSFGSDYKGFSVMIQLYGVFNVTRLVRNLNAFYGATRAILHTESLDYWRPDYNPTATYGPTKAMHSIWNGTYDAQMWHYDASYLRLKTAEIAYTFSKGLVTRMKMSAFRLYINGNNLFFWSDMPDDLESETFDMRNGYPLYRRINLGASITF
jgi:TonB-linked SusC/RagA family outer membrane protein